MKTSLHNKNINNAETGCIVVPKVNPWHCAPEIVIQKYFAFCTYCIIYSVSFVVQKEQKVKHR